MKCCQSPNGEGAVGMVGLAARVSFQGGPRTLGRGRAAYGVLSSILFVHWLAGLPKAVASMPSTSVLPPSLQYPRYDMRPPGRPACDSEAWHWWQDQHATAVEDDAFSFETDAARGTFTETILRREMAERDFRRAQAELFQQEDHCQLDPPFNFSASSFEVEPSSSCHLNCCVGRVVAIRQHHAGCISLGDRA